MSGSISPRPLPTYVQSAALPFLASLPVDRALARTDLAGSIAHVRMLAHAGIISSDEASALTKGLRQVASEIAQDSFAWRTEFEDVHTNVEQRLIDLIGPAVGGKLHSGRSRNDQIALDERLYVRQACLEVGRGILALEQVLVDRAAQEVDTLLPGYTHLQRAQPVSLAHHLLAHFWRLDRDLDRLLSTERRSDISPLGAGALAGSTLPTDPSHVARTLGFAGAFENSLDAVSDRDPLVELLFDLALLGVHLSSLGEELVLWTSSEFGFAKAGARLGSGSSLMPQKRNADVAELARAKAGPLIGDLVALLVTLKGLPLAYDRDLQEDKPPLFESVRTVSATLAALAPALGEITFDRERMRLAASDPLLRATDLAEELVRQGIPFRSAHEAVANWVRESMPTFSPTTVRASVPEIGAAADTLLDPATALSGRRTPGGPSPSSVSVQLAHARERWAVRADSLSSLGQKAGLIEELLKEEP